MNTHYFTEQNNFYGNTTPEKLIKEYGSPLYIYNERILRKRCREMMELISYPRFRVNYSIKSNSNLELLRIIHSEGLRADAMSPGEIYVLEKAGFQPQEIFYVSNNVAVDEMSFAVDRNILISIDSLSQLEQYGRLNPGSKVAIRFNPGIGLGHHQKVVTAGKKTKFGVAPYLVESVKEICRKYRLQVSGINQHLGSLFLEKDSFIEGVNSLLRIASEFPDLDFVDLGGGFGIPYHKQNGQTRLELKNLGAELAELLQSWVRIYGKEIAFAIEPGRYIVAESGVLLGTVNAVKENFDVNYLGTDLGLNVLIRPTLYDSYHDLEIYSKFKREDERDSKLYTVVGNICESGDIIAKDRSLPEVLEGDIIGVMDAGAYGFSMCSNYNNRLRPAEVLVRDNGESILIRRRDTFEDLMRNFIF